MRPAASSIPAAGRRGAGRSRRPRGPARRRPRRRPRPARGPGRAQRRPRPLHPVPRRRPAAPGRRRPGPPRPRRPAARGWWPAPARRGQPATSRSATSAAASSTCSQLSSTSSPRRAARCSAGRVEPSACRAPGRGRPRRPRRRRRRRAALTGASSHHHTPPGKRSSSRPASSAARRVFPAPPTPLSVTSGRPPGGAAARARWSSRPRKRLARAGTRDRRARSAGARRPAPARPRLGGQLVGEDAALELACLGGGLQAQLAQRGGERAIGGQRLDLAAGAIQRDHQRPREVLVQRVLGGEPFELAGRLRRRPSVDERARPVRLGPPAQLVEAPDLGLGEVDAGQLRERRPAPQRQRFVEGAQPDGRGQRRGPVHQRLEASRVHLLGRDLQPVAGAGTRQRGGGQEPAQVRQAHRQRARRGAGIDPGPRGLQQRVGRDRAAGVEQQAAEDEALLGSRRRGRAGAVDLQRPEHAELHAATIPPSRCGRRAVGGP